MNINYKKLSHQQLSKLITNCRNELLRRNENE